MKSARTLVQGSPREEIHSSSFREIGRAFRRLIVAQNARTFLTGDIQFPVSSSFRLLALP
jgi:hypothetical protein